MTPQKELDEIYISIGEGKEMTDELSKRINELESIVNPSPLDIYSKEDLTEEKSCGCGNPKYCWDCAAIRGGCPEDA